MANALKTLFTDIAESIRGGLPDEGLMKPNVFPSKIDEIVALLENAGSSEGGTGSSGSVGNLKFARGSYNVGTNRNRATVTHGFNTMPDLIIVWYTGFYGGTKEEYIEEFPLELAWGMKSKFSSKTLSGYVIPGFGVSANSGINNYIDNNIGIYCPDQYTFQFGSSANDGGGRLLTGASYNWLAISGMGGVDSDLVKYVTFIGADGTELYKMPVLDGDDCKDPYTRGDIEKPTKESTVSQVFTYNGWALTDGGSADANALESVTEDRTVYAAFTESVRYYTVRFYDGDTLLTTKQVEYGGSATHTTTKENYLLSGWNPEPTNVSSDMDCYAVWMEFQVIPFAEASWEYISMVSQMGIASKVFSLGDTKTITVKVGANPAEDVNLSIAEFDCPEKDGKTAMALIPTSLISARTEWHAVGSGCEGTKDYSTYITKTYHSYLTGTVVAALPSELQAVMKQGKWKGSGTGYVSITGLTTSEIGRTGNGTTDCLFGFNDTSESRIRKDKNGTAQDWWVVGTGSEVTASSSLRKYPIYTNTAGNVTTGTSVNYRTINYVMFKIFV